ncbi:MAG: IS3 family transposase [Planctomycetes bacterium]|nr:IS3 family transposase [Planctomycetota bacterium]
MVSPAQKRDAVQALIDLGRPVAVACKRVGLALSTWLYKPHPREDEAELIARLHELAKERPRFGYLRMTRILRREGWVINKKRVQRLWQKEGLQVPKKSRKRRKWRKDHPWPDRGKHRNHVWTVDFLFDRTLDGKPIKVLSVLDEFTRECLALPCARSLGAEDVVRVLDLVRAKRGAPVYVRADNGPEFISNALQKWEKRSGAKMRFIKPGSPWQNGTVESFHDKLRDEYLQLETFATVAEARVLLEQWRVDYNEYRPHSSLDYLTPSEFAALPCGADSASLHQPHREETCQV